MSSNLQKWVDALESGDYQQIRNSLRTNDGYCAWGVGCEVFRQETGCGRWEEEEDNPGTYEFVISVGDSTAKGHGAVANWYGIDGTFTRLGKQVDIPSYIVELNDDWESDFDEIVSLTSLIPQFKRDVKYE